MRHALVALILAGAVWSAACASTGAVPSPFPRPAASSPGAAPAPNPAPPVLEPPAPTADVPVAAPAEPDPLASTALAYRGVRYRNGGSFPEDGFDCSGLVWYVLAQHGIAVPRTVLEQYRVGTSVSAAEVRAGDLVFFNTTGVSPSHVGISIGGDEFVHAPNSSGEVRVEHLGARYWSERFVGIRRVE
jgi:cell wall-associated NlpC family hydrolase